MNQPNDPTAWTPEERGQYLFEEDRFAEAAEQWTLALQSDPTNFELLLRRAAAFFYEAEFDKSLADLDRAVELAPNDPSPYLRRAEIRSVLDEMAETLDDINRALELEPDSVNAYVALAVYWSAHFDLDKLETAANRAVRIDSQDYAALIYQGLSMDWHGRPDSLERFDQAREILEKRLTTEYRSYDLLSFYASLHSWRQEDEPARGLLDEGVRRFSKIPYFYILRATHHLKWGRPDAAQQDLNVAQNMMERHGLKNSEYFLARSDLFAQQGDYQQAMTSLQTLLQWMPNSPHAIQSELSLMQELIGEGKEDAEKALKIADHLCELAPDYSYAFILRAWLLHQQGKEHDANADFEHALKNLPATSEDRRSASHYLIEAGRLATARDLLCKVLEKEPEQVHALGLRGIVWSGLGAYDRAVQDFDQALEKGGPDAYLLMQRGAALIELGTYGFTCASYRRAIKDFTHALELEPKNALHWRLRGVAWFRIARKPCFGTKTSLQNAVEDYSEAIRLNPDDADTWHYRALVHWQRLELDAVIDDCSEAIKRKPNDLDALRLRAQAYRRKKQLSEAAKDYLEVERILNADES